MRAIWPASSVLVWAAEGVETVEQLSLSLAWDATRCRSSCSPARSAWCGASRPYTQAPNPACP